MNKTFIVSLISLFTGAVFYISCRKPPPDPVYNGNEPPIAVAGSDQVIFLPVDSAVLDGSASSDPDGALSSFMWKEISGISMVFISNPSDIKTVVKNLAAGIYKFELKLTDNKGLSATDTVQITVTDPRPPNQPPVADAGPDQIVILPANTIILNGNASTDPDNNIYSYLWTKISGPSSFNIVNTNAVQTQITNLVEGIYKFELRVIDSLGLFDKDTVTVRVEVLCPQPSPPPPCVTNCGKIVFVSDRDGNDEIYTCDSDGSNITRLTNDPAWDADPAWSPDGTKIAFERNGKIFIMNADGSNPVQKTFSGYNTNPTWSPDGNRIAYIGTKFEILDLTSGSVSTLQWFGGIEMFGSSVSPSPAWSPDGTKIAFDSDGKAWDFVSDIFTICPNGGNLSLLTPQFFNDYDYFKPAWSPTGAKLSVTIFPITGNGNTSPAKIAVMNSDGTGLTVIKTGNFGEFQEVITKTSWSPGGTYIAYTLIDTNNVKIIKWVASDGSGAEGTIITNGWDADWKH